MNLKAGLADEVARLYKNKGGRGHPNYLFINAYSTGQSILICERHATYNANGVAQGFDRIFAKQLIMCAQICFYNNQVRSFKSYGNTVGERGLSLPFDSHAP